MVITDIQILFFYNDQSPGSTGNPGRSEPDNNSNNNFTNTNNNNNKNNNNKNYNNDNQNDNAIFLKKRDL